MDHATDLSPEEFREWIENWHKEETIRIEKIAAAQNKDATDFVTAYREGRLTHHEASSKWMDYLERWGEPVFEAGAHLDAMSDTQVVKLAEKIRRERAGGARNR